MGYNLELNYINVFLGKSRVKFSNKLGNGFHCSLGVRQVECLSSLLFSLYLNDIDEQFSNLGFVGIDVDLLKDTKLIA